jgi:hypothetical protein
MHCLRRRVPQARPSTSTRARDPKDAPAIVATRLKRPVGEPLLPALDSPGRQGWPDSPLAGVVAPSAKAVRSPRLRRVSSPHSKGCRMIAMFPVARRVVPCSPIPALRIRRSASKSRSPWSACDETRRSRGDLAALANEESLRLHRTLLVRAFRLPDSPLPGAVARQHVEKASGRTSLACDVYGSHSITAIGASCYE